MTRITKATLPLLLIGLMVLLGATAEKPGRPVQKEPAPAQSAPTELTKPELPETQAGPTTATAAAYSVDWYVISSGGVLGAASTNWSLDATIGQPLAGSGSSTNYTLEVGFWYGAESCPIALTGDADNNGEVKLSDVIVLVNYVLKAGADPVPCPASGDVTCDGEVKLSDVIYLVNYVLKAGPVPCNVCDIIPSQWSCP